GIRGGGRAGGRATASDHRGVRILAGGSSGGRSCGVSSTAFPDWVDGALLENGGAGGYVTAPRWPRAVQRTVRTKLALLFLTRKWFSFCSVTTQSLCQSSITRFGGLA